MNDQEIFRKIAELKDQGNAVSLATIVEAEGSTPREVGGTFSFHDGGQTDGVALSFQFSDFSKNFLVIHGLIPIAARSDRA